MRTLLCLALTCWVLCAAQNGDLGQQTDTKLEIQQATDKASAFIDQIGKIDKQTLIPSAVDQQVSSLAGVAKRLAPLTGALGALIQFAFAFLKTESDPNAPIIMAISGISAQLNALQSSVDNIAGDVKGIASLDEYKAHREDLRKVLRASTRFTGLPNDDTKQDFVRACRASPPRDFLGYLSDEASGQCNPGSCLLSDGVIFRAQWSRPDTADLLASFMRDAATALGMDDACGSAQADDESTVQFDNSQNTDTLQTIGENLDHFAFSVQLGFFQGSLPGSDPDPNQGFESDVLSSLNTADDNQAKANQICDTLSSKYTQFIWSVLVWDGFEGKGPKNFQKNFSSSGDCATIPPASTCGSDFSGGAHGEIDINKHEGGGPTTTTSFYVTFSPPGEDVDVSALDQVVSSAADSCNLRPIESSTGPIDTQDAFDCLTSALQDSQVLRGLAIVAKGNGHTGFKGTGVSLLTLEVNRNDGIDTTIQILTAAKPK